MVAVITGDIMNSRKLKDQSAWLNPIKEIFSDWGKSPKTWEIYRGDGFQLEIAEPEEVLKVAFRIRSVVRSVPAEQGGKLKSPIDVRMAIGIGEKTYAADRISESNGSAFVNSGEQFETLKKSKTTLAIRTGRADFDEPLNIHLGFASITMSTWSIATAELMNIVLQHPEYSQTETGKLLGIEQNTVSDRYRRAHVQEFLNLEAYFRRTVKRMFLQ